MHSCGLDPQMRFAIFETSRKRKTRRVGDEMLHSPHPPQSFRSRPILPVAKEIETEIRGTFGLLANQVTVIGFNAK